MRALLIGYFFLITVLAALPVVAADRLRARYHRPWLSPYASFLAAWGAVVLLSVGQYMLLGRFLPGSAWSEASAATRPLFFIAFGVAVYFLGSFLAPKCVPLGYCDEFNNRDEHCPIRPHKDNVLAAWAEKKAAAKAAGRDLPTL